MDKKQMPISELPFNFDGLEPQYQFGILPNHKGFSKLLTRCRCVLRPSCFVQK